MDCKILGIKIHLLLRDSCIILNKTWAGYDIRPYTRFPLDQIVLFGSGMDLIVMFYISL